MDKIRVGCAVVAREGKRVVLGRRGKDPFYGKWVLPGGGVELFERFNDTAKREFQEETGLDIMIEHISKVEEIIAEPKEHRIVIFVQARVSGGCALAGSDLLEVSYFSREQLRALAASDELTPTVQRVLTELGWLALAPVPSRKRRPSPTMVSRARPAFRRRTTSAQPVGGVQLELMGIRPASTDEASAC